MKKINPIKNVSLVASKEAYDDLFDDIHYYIKTKLKARGIHDLIAQIYMGKITGGDVLDIGCGLGRFSFIASEFANSVTGLDMTRKAIEVAESINQSLNLKNVKFVTSTIEDFKVSKKYDFILLSGTLEHIIDADQFFVKVRQLLKPGGIFVTDSPSEFNFRGVFHASLWKLFNFPMTLTDVRIVTPSFMKTKSNANKLQVNKVIGTLYKRGWGSEAVRDLKERIPNVLRDVVEKTKKIEINEKDYFHWVTEGGELFEKLLDKWKDDGLIESISSERQFKGVLNEEILSSKKLPIDIIKEYLRPDFSIDPYYSRIEPINYFGGNLIYEITHLE